MTAQPFIFSQEKDFTDNMTGPIAALWQQRQEGTFIGVNHCKIGWVSLTSGKSDKVIVVVNGRIESYWKYQELFFDLMHQGYDIYALDNRGQGVSDRLIADPEMGYVEHFDDYVDDLYQFVTKIVKPQGYQQHFILGHSMGGAISSLLLARYPELFDRAALSAPMHGIYIKPLLKPFAQALTWLNTHCHRAPTYAPGQRPYYVKPFANNPLSHSQIRFQWSTKLYQQHSELRLGGASNRWVWQSILGAQQCLTSANKITTPVLILQGSADHIVDNHAHEKFCQQIQQQYHCQLVTINDAYHELLFESDQYRNVALNAICHHFANTDKI